MFCFFITKQLSGHVYKLNRYNCSLPLLTMYTINLVSKVGCELFVNLNAALFRHGLHLSSYIARDYDDFCLDNLIL